MNVADREVGQPGKRRGGPLVEQVRCVAITEDGRELGVKLGERGPKGSLTGRIGPAPEVAGDGMHCLRNEVSESECAHRLAVRLLSRFA
jgi:hypothetical protein